MPEQFLPTMIEVGGRSAFTGKPFRGPMSERIQRWEYTVKPVGFRSLRRWRLEKAIAATKPASVVDDFWCECRCHPCQC